MSLLADLPIDAIDPGDNDRHVFDEEALDSLTRSIARDGLLQPITVRTIPTMFDTRFQIIAGERRWRACQRAGLPTVRAIVTDLDDDAAARAMLAENTVRADLDPMEEARAYQRRLDAGATIDQLVHEGQRRARIDLLLPLLTLCPEAQHMIARRQLAPTLARRMLGLCSNRQVLALRGLSAGELTSSQFQALCSRLRKEQDAEPLFDPDKFMQAQTWAKGRAPLGPLGQARVLLKRCAAALDATDPALAAEVRGWLAEQNKA